MTNAYRSAIYRIGEFRIDTAKRLLTRGADGEVIPLTPKIFDTLVYFAENNGKVIEKDELMREIWSDTIVEENNLNKNISVLRRVLGEKPGEHRFIVTVPGHGYKFVAEVIKEEEKPEDVEARRSIPELSASAGAEDGDEVESAIEIDREPRPEARAFRLYGLAALILLIGAAAAVYFWRSPPVPGPSPVRTIAVLPFKSLGGENRNEALELGMADSLIAKLGGQDLIVRPLGSVSRYASLEQDSLLAGRELGVENVLDGTIQTADNRIRIAARLFRASDGKQLWSGQFDEKFTDIFAVQDAISERVAAALKIRLESGGEKRDTKNVEAYQFYMKGRFHMLKAIGSETETGISYFQRAIEADPSYALAYAGLADAYRGQAVGGEMPSAEVFAKARAAANRALEIDETLAEAHANLGHILFWYDWDWKAAENQHRRALELNPNSADSLQFYAHLLSNTGRHAEALVKIKRARELDPLNLRINALEGLFLLHAGRTDEAIAALRKTLELDSNFRLANMFAARAYIEKGLFAEAIAATRRARVFSPLSSEPIAYGAYALAKAGEIAAARAALDEMLKLSATRYVPPYNFALVYNALGESAKALDQLEKAYAEKDVRMVFLKVEPKWNNLRAEPRFVELTRKMNFD
jgi:DNA-binding winged helix-turn-helix (wHTH) protein/TolB-like protein